MTGLQELLSRGYPALIQAPGTLMGQKVLGQKVPGTFSASATPGRP